MAYSLRCPECRGKFPWQPSAEWPRYCPLCSADIHSDNIDNDVISLPAMRSAVTSAHDKLQNDIMKSSEVRAEKAAEMAGVPVSEMSSLKITDMNSTRREGDVAAVDDKAAAARLAPAGGQALDFFKPNGSEFKAGIATGDVTVNGHTTRGIAPRAGMNALAGIQRAMGRR